MQGQHLPFLRFFIIAGHDGRRFVQRKASRSAKAIGQGIVSQPFRQCIKAGLGNVASCNAMADG